MRATRRRKVMEEINGQWVLKGIDWDDDGCLHSADELAELIEDIGFLPLFECQIPGLSVEEHTMYSTLKTMGSIPIPFDKSTS